MALPARKRSTIEDYLAAQAQAPIKLEFVDGCIVTQTGELWEELREQHELDEIMAMVGGSRAHARLISNLHFGLRLALRGRRCEVSLSEQRFRDPIFRRVRYPDGMVTCGPVELDSADPEAITNPTVVFEALSASTANIDRGEKSEQYRATPSVRAIVFLDSRRRHCESLSRNDDGSWVLRVHEGVLPLPCIDVELSLNELYEGVLDGAAESAD